MTPKQTNHWSSYQLCCDPLVSTGTTSRRRLLGTGAALVAGAAAASMSGPPAVAQAPAADLARLQSARRILLEGGLVLSMDRQVGDFVQADILIEDGKIRELRPNIGATGDDIAMVDAGNHIVVPGFIDTHSHSYQGLLRGTLASGLLNPDYNRDVQTVLTPAYQPGDAYAGVLATALAMIDAGTTTIVDISQVSHSPEHSDAVVKALQEAGIRAVYSYHRGAGANSQFPQDIKRLQRTYFSSKNQLLTLALTGNLMPNLHKLAREVGVPIVQHLVGANLTPSLQALASEGLLKAGDEYIHCLGIDDTGWRLIKDSGGRVSICAAIDMTMGHGTPAIQEALDQGFRPSLSSDHSVTITQDPFSLMRATMIFQRWQLLQRARQSGQAIPPLLTCRDMLEFATIEGARCANLEPKAGSLTPGKEADIVMLRSDAIDVWPLNNAAGTVVNFMNPANVDTVFVAGKLRKWRGNLVGVDMDRTRRLIEDSRDSVIRRANYPINLLG
jgi:cytosine/adenosine deaminase-related metal-dependent hydrolase